MKKNYIIPVAHTIILSVEDTLLTGSIAKSSDSISNENQILSNKHDASDAIWGED